MEEAKMKKKSIAARLGVAALALTLVTTSLSSGTLAKYTETYKAKATFEVAKWNVFAKLTKNEAGDAWSSMVSSGNIPEAKLAETVYDAQKNHVKSGAIAPGMEGEFFVNVSAAGAAADAPSGVDVKYEIFINKEGTPPTNFTMTNGTTSETINFSDAKDDTTYGWSLGTGVLPADTSNDVRKVKVKWAWPYETSGGGGDADDTADGTGNTVGYQISVLFTQVNPNATPTPAPGT